MNENQLFDMFSNLEPSLIRDVMAELNGSQEAIIEMLSMLSGVSPHPFAQQRNPMDETENSRNSWNESSIVHHTSHHECQTISRGWWPECPYLSSLHRSVPVTFCIDSEAKDNRVSEGWQRSRGRPPDGSKIQPFPFPHRQVADEHLETRADLEWILPASLLDVGQHATQHPIASASDGIDVTHTPTSASCTSWTTGNIQTLEFLLSSFTGDLEDSIVKEVFESSRFDAQAAIDRLTDMAGDNVDSMLQQKFIEDLSDEQKVSLLQEQFPELPEAALVSVLIERRGNIDASIAQVSTLFTDMDERIFYEFARNNVAML